MFDIAELREVTSYDELELDTLGDRKTALFLIMSDYLPSGTYDAVEEKDYQYGVDIGKILLLRKSTS